MADDGIPDIDLEDMLDWLYVEDDFPLADELAESQIPDPGYAGTKYEIDVDELDDFDVFDYWDDLQYGDDSYWEYAATRSGATLKRKRPINAASKHLEKRQRLAIVDTAGDNVRFVSRVRRNEIAVKRASPVPKRKSFALFPDWRKRFADLDGTPANTEMPLAMKKAAEGTHVDNPTKTSASKAHFVDTNGVEVEDGENDNDADGMQIDLSSLDPDTLKAILRQKLGDSGLAGMDENALMDMLDKMLSGEEGVDDVVDYMANDLEERATEGNDVALSGWLNQQGVSLDTMADGEEDTESVATAELPYTVNGLKDAEKVKSSPSDSAIDIQKTVTGTSTEMAIHPSSPSELVRKRVAPFAEDEAREIRKRKRVSFEVAPPEHSISVAQPDRMKPHEVTAEQPTSSISQVQSVSQDSAEPEDDNIIVTQTHEVNLNDSNAPSGDIPFVPDNTNEDDDDNIVVTQTQDENFKDSDLQSTDVPSPAENTAEEDNITVTPPHTKAQNNKAVHHNKIVSTTATDPQPKELSRASKPKPETKSNANTKIEQEEADEIAVAPSAPAKNTRKRKATETSTKAAPAAKKQARKASASAPVDADAEAIEVGKRTSTRSTRAAAKARAMK